MAKQMEFVSGAVTSVNSKKTGIKVVGCDDWLNISMYRPVPVVPTVGELVEVQFEQTDRGAWINDLKIPGDSTPAASPAPVSDRRLSSITIAAQLVGAFSQTHEEVRVDHVFPLADKILAWLEKGGDATD